MKKVLTGTDGSSIISYVATHKRCEARIDAWLSLVERCVRDAEVAGSNPVASIKKGPCRRRGPFLIDSIEREPATSAVTNIRGAEGGNVQWTFPRFKSCRIDVVKSRVSGDRNPYFFVQF